MCTATYFSGLFAVDGMELIRRGRFIPSKHVTFAVPLFQLYPHFSFLPCHIYV